MENMISRQILTMKVRDYGKKNAETGEGNGGSYWELGKNDRKRKTCLMYEELVEVMERRAGGQQRMLTCAGGSGSNPKTSYLVERPMTDVHATFSTASSFAASSLICSSPTTIRATTSSAASSNPISRAISHSRCVIAQILMQGSIQISDSPAKRRRRGGGGTSGGTTSASTSHEVRTAISKSASIIAEAIQAFDEREERRHIDLLSLHERRLKIEESKTEINRQGINDLVDAINKLANSILAPASHKNESSCPK
ncbi:hypothetical protein SADUNF_Sadunf12G0075600 [Salix dunnii]|uniref:Uncharacterized protein n=1 Tax=Salix dunnii TaxID=1413687 RepID=A0A835MW42_9ROSI|nr:hypothetical protein SADUNF_Sadunf12G0075600 [Salix dunnii]